MHSGEGATKFMYLNGHTLRRSMGRTLRAPTVAIRACLSLPEKSWPVHGLCFAGLGREGETNATHWENNGPTTCSCDGRDSSSAYESRDLELGKVIERQKNSKAMGDHWDPSPQT